MQRQPGSMFLVADAYRRELLADAARTRPKMPSGSDRRGSSICLLPPRRLVGTVLIRAGERLQRVRATPLEEPVTASPA